MLGKQAVSTAVPQREAWSWIREGVSACSMNWAIMGHAVWCRNLGRERLCCAACARYSWKSTPLWVLYNKRGRGVQLATRFNVDLEVFWDHQQIKVSLPMTHWKNIGYILSILWVRIYSVSSDYVFKLNCIMTSLYDWRGSPSKVWLSKNRHAPDGENNRAGAVTGLASVTAPGVLSKILFSSFSSLWISLEKEPTGWGQPIKETRVCEEAFHDTHEWTNSCIQEIKARTAWIRGFNSVTWTAKPAQMALQETLSNEWWDKLGHRIGDQNCYTTFSFQIRTYIQNNFSFHTCCSFFCLSYCKVFEVEEGYIVTSKYKFTEYKWIRWELCEMPYK